MLHGKFFIFDSIPGCSNVVSLLSKAEYYVLLLARLYESRDMDDGPKELYGGDKYATSTFKHFLDENLAKIW